MEASTVKRPLVRGFKGLCRVMNYIAILVVGYMVGTQIARLMMRPPYDYLPLLISTLSIMLTIWVASIVIHETGHFVAARLQGMYVTEVRVLWLHISARRRGYKFALTRRMRAASGIVKACSNPKLGLSRQFALFILGGPTANICFAILSAAMAGLSGLLGLHPAAVILSATATINAYMGFANLLPVGKKIPSDGSRLYYWLFDGTKDPAELALLRIMGLSVAGQRARDYEAAEISLLIESPKAAQQFTGGWLSLRGAIDRQDIGMARRIFEQYSDSYAALDKDARQSIDGLWKFFLLEHAYLRALSGESSFDAHQELEATGREAIPPFMRLRLQAAMHFADGAHTEARASSMKARLEAEDTFDAGTRLEELDLLDQLDSAIQAV